ncbi:MAG TPA: insulinase family protein [Ilumatobacteraceae bacterium]|nr:insulinase family protein [Ilumatobacteraceae bacterium]
MAKRCGRRQWTLVAVLLLTSACTTAGPGVAAREATPIGSGGGSETIPDDPGVHILKLSNGLTVYLRANNRPGLSAEMRLVINAGSGQEDSDQSGTAHFLEHMMFNGTTEFPANELIDTLRGFGMTFGADVNAYTSYDETVYELTVPTTESTNLTTGLDVLHEWLSSATLDPAEVDREKGVVLDEWRQSDQSFDGRVSVATEKMMLAGSEYENREPIGTDTAINAMTPDLLRRFYDTWYRPDNAAIMVVGDIDVDKVESEIRERFETLTARGESKPRTDPALGTYGTPDASVLVDPDATTGNVSISLPRQNIADNTVASRRQSTLVSLAITMITTRLTDDVSRGLAPFVSAVTDNNGLVRRLDAPSVAVSGEPAQLQASFEALTLELERARRYGFDAGELDRAVRGFRSSSQALFDGRDTVQDADFIARYVDHLLAGSSIPTADTTFQIDQAILDDVTPEAVASAFNDLLTSAAPHVIVVAPDSATDVPSRDSVLARVAALPTLDVTPREATTAGATELMAAPDPVPETASESLDGDGGFVAPTMLTFANGARVVLNPTEIADNDISFSATSPGGLSLVADADVPDALNAVAVVTSSGIGDLDPVQLDTLLSDAQIQLSPSIGQTSEDFAGTSTTDDLELLFQLVNQYISKPRFDKAGLDSTIGYLKPYVDDPDSDPDLAEYVAYSAARYGPEPRFRVIPTADELAGLDLGTIERVWRDRFSNASDWVFAISGDFDIDEASDLARRYIGTLSGTGATEKYKDFQIDPPSTVITKEVHAGTGAKGSLSFEWNADYAETVGESVYADLLTSVLNTRLTDHIREALGASYSPSASVGILKEPDHLVQSYLNVTGDPSSIAKISPIVIDDITSLRTDGPTTAEFDAAIAEMTDTYQYYDNQTISDLLVKAPNEPDLIPQFSHRATTLTNITEGDLKTFIDNVMPLDRYIEIRTLPA